MPQPSPYAWTIGFPSSSSTCGRPETCAAPSWASRWARSSRPRSDMDASDLKGLFAEVNKRMNVAIDHLKHELAGVRTGRASTALLDHVHVEAYGSKLPMNQVATLSVPEPSLIVAQPFDPSLLAAVERGIRLSDLGLNPSSDGKVIRIP